MRGGGLSWNVLWVLYLRPLPERSNGPLEVVVPVGLSEGKSLSDSGLVDLDGLDTGSLQIGNLVPQSEGELLALNLSRGIGSGERPVQDLKRTANEVR